MGADLPSGRDFAFTIFDDTDYGTVENLRPVYRFLSELGVRSPSLFGVSPRSRLAKSVDSRSRIRLTEHSYAGCATRDTRSVPTTSGT